MRFLILYLLIYLSCINPTYANERYEYKLSGSNLLLSRTANNAQLCLFKPSRLILAEDNKILIKGIPGNFVSLAYSKSNSGSSLMGQKTRLGSDFQTVEGKINEKGFVELNLNLGESKFNEGDNLYLELASWSDKNYKDLTLAKIYGIDGQITNSNSISVVKKIKNNALPMFSPVMGANEGVNSNFNDTIDAIKSINDGSYNDNKYTYPKELFYDKPSMFSNINAPEMQRK